MTDDFDPADEEMLHDMMEMTPEHDPEHQRERIREQLQILVHDAVIDELVDPPVAVTIEEHHLLVCDPLDDRDYCWTAKWDGGDTATIVAPDGEYTDEIPLESNEPDQLGGLRVDETFKAFGQVASAWHLRRRMREFHELREHGELDDRFADEGTFLLPNAKLGLRDDGHVAVYNPAHEVDQVIAAAEVAVETVEAAEDRWRDQMREKYAGTPMAEDW